MAGGAFSIQEEEFPPLPTSKQIRSSFTTSQTQPGFKSLLVGALQIPVSTPQMAPPFKEGSNSTVPKIQSAAKELLDGSPAKSPLPPSKLAQAFMGDLALRPQNKIHGSPCVTFKVLQKSFLLSKIRYLLIAKFSHGRPKFIDFESFLRAMRFKGSYRICEFDMKHVFVEFDVFEDFVSMWMLKSSLIKGFRVRYFQWKPDFHPSVESFFAPVWVHLPALPLFLFDEDAVLAIASLFGNLLFIDPSNLDRKKVGQLSFCVARDVRITGIKGFWIEFVEDSLFVDRFWQKAEYGSFPDFCDSCNHIGHVSKMCKAARIVDAQNRDGSLAILSSVKDAAKEGQGRGNLDVPIKDTVDTPIQVVTISTIFDRLTSLNSPPEAASNSLDPGPELEQSKEECLGILVQDVAASSELENLGDTGHVSKVSKDPSPIQTAAQNIHTVREIPPQVTTLVEDESSGSGAEGNTVPVSQVSRSLWSHKQDKRPHDNRAKSDGIISPRAPRQTGKLNSSSSAPNLQETCRDEVSLLVREEVLEYIQQAKANNASRVIMDFRKKLNPNDLGYLASEQIPISNFSGEISKVHVLTNKADELQGMNQVKSMLVHQVPCPPKIVIKHPATKETVDLALLFSNSHAQSSPEDDRSSTGSCFPNGDGMTANTEQKNTKTCNKGKDAVTQTDQDLNPSTNNGSKTSMCSEVKQTKAKTKTKQGKKTAKQGTKKKQKKKVISDEEEAYNSEEFWGKMYAYREANPFTEEEIQESENFFNSLRGGIHGTEFSDAEQEVNSFQPRDRKISASGSPSLDYLDLDVGLSNASFKDKFYPP